MFSATSIFGFPYKARFIIERYETGMLTLRETLKMLGAMYSSNVKKYYTYDENGKKISHTCIEFGCPVVMQYVF